AVCRTQGRLIGRRSLFFERAGPVYQRRKGAYNTIEQPRHRVAVGLAAEHLTVLEMLSRLG
ncbi:MAG: hypothetical protein NZO58_13500, partial [Gemmataceae bacterium]|nr:hypothetical protein [Gemmataceae bacterium]